MNEARDRVWAAIDEYEDGELGNRQHLKDAVDAALDAFTSAPDRALAGRIRETMEKVRGEFHDTGCHGRSCDCNVHVSGAACCRAGHIVDEVRVLIYPLLAV